MKDLILLLLVAVALSKAARLSWSDCLNKETVNILVSHENCHKFYQCDDGKLIPKRCPSKLVFNVEDQRCDWPHNVDCQNRGIPEDSDEDEPESGTGGGHNDPSEAPAICAEEDSDGILIAHGYCNKYYICNGGQPVAMFCPPDLFFNAGIDQCDWPKNVECEREVAPQPQQPDSSDEDDEHNLPEPEVQPESEPEPQPDNSNENGDGNGNSDPSEAPEICATAESDGILIAHEYCNKYYICSEGTPVARPCPPGLLFNANKDQCDWPENVECDREIAPKPQPEASNEVDVSQEVPKPQPEPVPEPQPEPVPEPDNGSGDDNEPIGSGNVDPSEAPEICATAESDGILVAHEHCNKYYICSEDKPVARPCPPGLLFNANKDQCDWPENVECDREIAPEPQPEASNEVGESEEVSEPQPNPVPEPDNGGGDNNGPIGGGNGDPSEAPEICTAADSDGILIAHEYCNKYYICSEGKPVARPCPPGLLFNANKDQCDWPENVECDREIAPEPQPEASNEVDESEEVSEPQPNPVPEPDNGGGDNNGPIGGGNGDPSEASEICTAADSDGILIAHEYCNKYYICSEGKPVARPCPPGLLFNANKDQCDWPENVECDREIAPEPQPEASNEVDESEEVSEPQPNPVPEPDNGGGDNNGPIGGGNGDPSEASEICTAADSDGILIAHEYCNKYYICSEGKPVARPCPPGLLFNANKDQCDWPENVECDREIAPEPQPEASNEVDESEEVSEPQPNPVPEPDNGGGDNNGPIGGGNGDPSEASEICTAADSDGILIAHEYCNKYYICSEGKPVARPCPPGLHFNANKDQCDWPENVECDREVAPEPQPEASNEVDDSQEVPEPQPETVPEPDNGSGDDNGSIGGGNVDPSEAPEICAAADSDGILIAHEYCNKYYICSEGKPITRPCPSGLLFNANKDQCDWPENVKCDREIAPEPQPEASDQEDESEEVPELQPKPVPEPDTGGGDDNGPIGNGNGDPSEASEICAAVDSDGILIAHEYCNKYYICTEGTPVARSCPPGLLFNANKDQCDWPENVECDREIAPEPQPEASNEVDESQEVPEPQPETVPKPDNGSGDDNGLVGGGNVDPSEASKICAAADSDGILIAHEYCNKYYVCSEGKPVARPCPSGLLFNANKDQCDWPENVECDREIAPESQPEASDENDESEEVPELQPEPVPEPDNGGGDDNGPIGGGNGDPSEAPEICAAVNSDGILIAHEYCNKYYICSEGTPVAKSCPPGLLFNANKDQCDWPENVECDREIAPTPQPEASNEVDKSQEVPEPQPETVPEPDNGSGDDNGLVGGGNVDPSEASKICAAADSDGILIAHEYCNKYYVCSEGKPVARPCPSGLLFNANKDQCDWPENVECDREIAPESQPEASDENDESEEVPELQPEPVPEPDNGDDNGPIGGGNGDPNEAPEICAAVDSDGILIAHEYCNKYYICSEGTPVAKSCPPGLLFNAKKDQCDWPENVECDREIAPEPQPEASNEVDESQEVPEPQPETVPEPDNGSGDDNGLVGGGNVNPSEASKICAAADSDGILIAHEYCNKYYVCSEGKPVARPCPSGLLFNANKDQCDWPENVECDREIAPESQPEASDENDESEVPELQPEPVPEPDNGGGDDNGGGNGDPSEAPEICAAANSDGILIAHEYCNKFYKCSESKPVAMICPNGLLFNANKNQCDWPENVECDREIAPQPQSDEENDNDSEVLEPESQPDDGDEENRPIGSGNSDSTQAEAICAADESDGVLVAHSNCNQFYVCNQGKSLVLSCATNLHFNPDTDQCDWPENVNCNKNIVAEPDDNQSSHKENDKEGNNDPSLAPSLCAADDSDGIIVAHENCNQFYVCSAGNPVALTCPLNLMYNPGNEQCNWSDKVDCGNRRVPTRSFYAKY